MTFESQQRAWERIPVDNVGYFSARALLQLPDERLRTIVEDMQRARYQGERNYENLWRSGMGSDALFGRVLDYGCGLGVEALQYAKSGNTVSVADINTSSTRLAARVLRLHGFNPARILKIREGPVLPMTDAPAGEYDLVVMNGVLHHIPDPVPTAEEAYRLLAPGGELRLMLYSDKGWTIATGTDPPQDVAADPSFMQFVRHFDTVGDWADWYDRPRLQERFGDLFDVADTRYIMANGQYMTATLVKR